jgi:hypothetical protein
MRLWYRQQLRFPKVSEHITVAIFKAKKSNSFSGSFGSEGRI